MHNSRNGAEDGALTCFAVNGSVFLKKKSPGILNKEEIAVCCLLTYWAGATEPVESRLSCGPARD